MSIPANLDFIATNLPRSQLEKVLQAVDAKVAHWIPGSSSVFVQSSGGKFAFDDAVYGLQESWEIVSSVYLVSAKQEFIAGLIAVLELEITTAVANRDFDAAKEIYGKVKSLSRATVTA